MNVFVHLDPDETGYVLTASFDGWYMDVTCSGRILRGPMSDSSREALVGWYRQRVDLLEIDVGES